MTTERPDKQSLADSLGFESQGPAAEEDFPAGDGSIQAVHRDPARQIEILEAANKGAAAADDDDDDSSEDFEFAFVVKDPEAFPSVTADEIFSGGRIIPAYPVFNLASSDAGETVAAADETDVAQLIPLRQLLIEERVARPASSSSQPEDSGEHCVWAPDRCKKSASTGSSLRWRLRDLMVGRSHSDGKEKFVFLDKVSGPKATAAAGKGAKKAGRGTGTDVVTAPMSYYGKGSGEKAVKGPRRSFLPYRQELFGLFAPVNGLRRSHHPY
ncbi:hypothetical protein OPV22_023267 [Ensete ventricosum]|uniref:DUF1645 domain-containing protein n=2 Tax=Ensete ventricosum TaxID=4639 RepID=A0A444FF29_ENSVE|nr:hypothetical protein OPV22_023267 [Ensete ventricosum]RWW21238.1 hypothetical protein GW17_00014616 [Ensete ventricosum]RZR71043.1 hypothetical protein BHM03_00002956 [Ensete ventricosum]